MNTLTRKKASEDSNRKSTDLIAKTDADLIAEVDTGLRDRILEDNNRKAESQADLKDRRAEDSHHELGDQTEPRCKRAGEDAKSKCAWRANNRRANVNSLVVKEASIKKPDLLLNAMRVDRRTTDLLEMRDVDQTTTGPQDAMIVDAEETDLLDLNLLAHSPRPDAPVHDSLAEQAQSSPSSNPNPVLLYPVILPNAQSAVMLSQTPAPKTRQSSCPAATSTARAASAIGSLNLITTPARSAAQTSLANSTAVELLHHQEEPTIEMP